MALHLRVSSYQFFCLLSTEIAIVLDMAEELSSMMADGFFKKLAQKEAVSSRGFLRAFSTTGS